jgi:5-methylcytosine-specific restriction enzyme B
MGSTRILRPLLADGLNFYAELSEGRAALSSHVGTANDAKAYVGRARLYESLFNSEDITAKSETQEENIQTVVEAPFPRNRVVVGAPGTGKSYRLDEDALSVGAEVTRTVFHSAMSFTQFFGSLRPMSSKDDEREVAFKFIPGPFIRTLVAALRQPSIAQVLLIEELNRADAAAVFGDVFQLLDRDMTGSSSYSISVSTECRTYLETQLPGYDFNSISIPSNFWIWCTLNPADQGVGHLDAAFLRRWTREYVSIDAGSEAVSHHILRLPQHSLTVPWNGFRIRLNELLSTKLERRIPEDRLLGPFFFTPAELGSSNHDFLFCDKLLNYVADDILRHSKSDFFGSPKLATFSSIRNDYFSNDHSLIRSWLTANFDSLIVPLQSVDEIPSDSLEPTVENDA